MATQTLDKPVQLSRPLSEEELIEHLVDLLHWCDASGLILEACLDKAERCFVDQLGEGPE